MIKSVLEKNLIPAIADASALAQMFIIILFFENYLILFQETSLFQLTIDFGSIQLAPFIWFFIFLVAGRFLWIAISFLISYFKGKANFNFDEQNKIESKHHLHAFFLLILTIVYFFNSESHNHQYVPFDTEKHWLLFYIYKLPLSSTIIISPLLIIFSKVKYSWEKE